MCHELVVAIESPKVRVVKIELHVLGIGYVEKRVLTIRVGFEMGYA